MKVTLKCYITHFILIRRKDHLWLLFWYSVFKAGQLRQEKHAEAGYINEAQSVLSRLVFFFKCPWGIANQLAMEKRLSFPQLILIWWSQNTYYSWVFQQMHFHRNLHWIHFIASTFSVSPHIIFSLPKQKPLHFPAAEIEIYFQYEDC